MPVQRPRVRAADGSGELPVPAYELFNSVAPTTLLGNTTASWRLTSAAAALFARTLAVTMPANALAGTYSGKVVTSIL